MSARDVLNLDTSGKANYHAVMSSQVTGKRILVTGGAGAIGSRLVRSLAPENNVLVIDDLSSGFEDNLKSCPEVEFVKGSVQLDADLEKAFAVSPQLVFHLAANFANQNSVDHPRKDLLVNGMGTLKVLEFAKAAAVERFVYASSSCVYGHYDADLSEACTSYNVETPYGFTKLLGERYTNFFHEFHGMSTVILRYFNSYGPGERPGRYRNVIPNFMALALQGKPLPITGTGDETRDFNFVDDTVRATLLAALAPDATGRTFNVASGRETRIGDLASAINRITGNRAGCEMRKPRMWDTILRRRGAIDLAREKLGYQPQVEIEEGLTRTLAWFRETGVASLLDA